MMLSGILDANDLSNRSSISFSSVAAEMNKKFANKESSKSYKHNLRSKQTRAIMKVLAKSMIKDDRVVGYACAVNGRVLYADVFSTPALAAEFRYRLLRSYAFEALRRGQKEGSGVATRKDVREFLDMGTFHEEEKTTTSGLSTQTVAVNSDKLKCEMKLDGVVVKQSYYLLEK